MKENKFSKIKNIVNNRVMFEGRSPSKYEEYIILCTNTLISSDLLNKDHTIAYRSVVYSAFEIEMLHGSKKTLSDYYSCIEGKKLNNNEIMRDFIEDLISDCCTIRHKINNLETKSYKILKPNWLMGE